MREGGEEIRKETKGGGEGKRKGTKESVKL